MTPPEVVTLLNEGLAAVVTVAGMVFVVIVGIAAFKYMRRAVGDDPWAGYTVRDDVTDRAIQYQADRTTFDADGNASLSDSRRDFSDASKDVIRNQKYFGHASQGADFVDHHAPIDQDAIDRARDDFMYR